MRIPKGSHWPPKNVEWPAKVSLALLLTILLGGPFPRLVERSAVGQQLRPKAATAPLADMWGGGPHRNNVRNSLNVPSEWAVGEFARRQRGAEPRWLNKGARNINWVVPIGSQTYSSPVVVDGRIFVGSNNGGGQLERFPEHIDLGCVLCYRETDGEFLWQYSARKLKAGRVNDWPLQGIPSTPTVEADRMWFVNNRGQVICLDTDGFRDGEDDGTTEGVWHEVFQSNIDLAQAFIGGKIPHVVESALRNEGVTFQHPAVKRRDSLLLIADQINGQLVEKFRIELGRDILDVFPLNVDGNALETPLQPICRIRRHPFASLREGRVDASMARILAGAGLQVGGQASLKEIPLVGQENSALRTDRTKADRAWNVAVTRNGIDTVCRLEVSGETVTATYRLVDLAQEADIVWEFDMMSKLGSFQHNMATCSPVIWGDLLFVNTGNGVDSSHRNLPSPEAASFVAFDKRTGQLLWSDNSPGEHVLHGQWCSPAAGILGGVPQVIFGGGDGWIYSFRADAWDAESQRPILLWKFDANPKESKWMLGGRGTRNNLVAFPVLHDDKVYVAMGQDPEHGEGAGCLWCIDPTKRGDVSPDVLIGRAVEEVPRAEFMSGFSAETVKPNPNSALIWKYDKVGDEFHQTFHRTLSSPVIKDNLLIAPDMAGIIHCLDATTGKVHWTCDSISTLWGSALIVDEKVFVGTEDGDVLVFPLTANPKLAVKMEKPADKDFATHGEVVWAMNVENSVYSTPTAANGSLIISGRQYLYSIGFPPE
jgi:outer membrane protein assembly factor BamB